MATRRAMTVQEIKQREACLKAGLPWPPPFQPSYESEGIQALPPTEPEIVKKVEKLMETTVNKANKLLADAARDQRDALLATQHERRQKMDEVFKRHDFDPVEELVEMLKPQIGSGSLFTPNERANYLMKLTEYVLPKMKSVEHSGTVDTNITVQIQRYGGEELKVLDLKSA